MSKWSTFVTENATVLEVEVEPRGDVVRYVPTVEDTYDVVGNNGYFNNLSIRGNPLAGGNYSQFIAERLIPFTQGEYVEIGTVGATQQLGETVADLFGGHAMRVSIVLQGPDNLGARQYFLTNQWMNWGGVSDAIALTSSGANHYDGSDYALEVVQEVGYQLKLRLRRTSPTTPTLKTRASILIEALASPQSYFTPLFGTGVSTATGTRFWPETTVGSKRMLDSGDVSNIPMTVSGANIGFEVDNLFDIGRYTTPGVVQNRPRNIYVAGAIANKMKAGTPVDADLTNPIDGMLVVDSTANKIWVRIGGVWKGVVVA